MKNRKGWAREETTGARRNSTSVFNFAKEKYMTLSIHMHSIKSLVHFFFFFFQGISFDSLKKTRNKKLEFQGRAQRMFSFLWSRLSKEKETKQKIAFACSSFFI